MNVLITNDDGIHACGIRALAEAVADIGHRVRVVAPDREKSACAHALTMDMPLTVKPVDLGCRLTLSRALRRTA